MLDMKLESPLQYAATNSLVLTDWNMVTECFVIYDDSIPIALLDINIRNDERTMEINEFETLVKGIGCGSRIVSELKKWATEDGLTITLYPHSEQSRGFWKKNGFHEVNEGCSVFSMQFTP